jgi:hypothetical protein
MMVVMPSLSKSKQCYPPETIEQKILLDNDNDQSQMHVTKSSRNQSKVCCKPASQQSSIEDWPTCSSCTARLLEEVLQMHVA